jgi:hypothetical protein
MIKFCPRSGKAMHRTSAEAAKAVARLGNKGSTYRCSHCSAYHFSRFPADAGSARRAMKKVHFKRNLHELE